MIPKECKRLAEVDFPIGPVGKYSLMEKTRRSGTPHQLHLWWSWKPLAACRSMLLGLLMPDPCDKHCPALFKQQARDLLPSVQGRVGRTDADLRSALLKFIGEFSNWDLSHNRNYLDVATTLIKTVAKVDTPLVVDPFAGGGSVPLEALRLGCDAFASDLNPVACLILKAKLADVQDHETDLRETLEKTAAQLHSRLLEELGDVFPHDANNVQPIAYIWARTVRCEAPNCGAEIPLKGSFWLTNKSKRRKALRFHVSNKKDMPPEVEFEIFEPRHEKEVPSGSVSRAKATCLCCNSVLSAERVRTQLHKQQGGADVVFDGTGRRIGGARLLVVVTVKPHSQGRYYRLAINRDYEPIWKAHQKIGSLEFSDLPNGYKLIPDEPLPPVGTLGFRVQRYGVLKWGQLFTKRQVLCLARLASHIGEISDLGTRELLALTLSKLAERNNVLCPWMMGVECPGHLFTQQVLPPSWDFAEAAPLGDSSGSFKLVVKHTANSAHSCVLGNGKKADVHLNDATTLGLPDESAALLFTDPPYYNSIPYSDLSDFFFVWLKRGLPKGHALLRDPFDTKNPLTPKVQELVQDEAKKVHEQFKDKEFWQGGMTRAFAEAKRVLHPDGIACVVFAHKTTEGWEALLEGMVRGGWVITASWPITTERTARVRARDSAALATSVHLVCRPRPDDAPVGDWSDVLRELPKRVGDWMERLQGEGIRGADLVFACIGPALEIFSRYSKVETADGREVKLAEYLEKVWEVVGRTALEQVLGTAEAKTRNGTAGAIEEDARLTALFLWTLQDTNGENGSSKKSENSDQEAEDDSGDDEEDDEESAPKSKAKGFSLVYDVVRRFAQPLGIELPKWEGRVIETKKGVVRLMAVSERAKQLFGDDGAEAVADWITEDPTRPLQQVLFPEMEEERVLKVRGRGRRRKAVMDPGDVEMQKDREATTLDRIHAAMLLQAGGQANALRQLINAEQDRGPDFLRLANALSALYPKGSEEKRLLDAMLLAVPR